MLQRIYIEISNICNLQCSFCPIVEREKKIMGVAEFKKIIDQAEPMAMQICLHLMGEPLTHPHLEEILNICNEKKVRVQLTTNGILIQRYKILLLNSPCLYQINFSLQSFQDNFPHRKLSSYLNDIFDFCTEAFNHCPDLFINLRLWNIDCNSNNEDLLLLIENFFKIKISRKIDVAGIKSKKLINRLYLHFDSRFQWPSLSLPFQGNQGRCNALSQHIGIHSDGTVVPCCLDKEAQIPLGNCLLEPLEKILNSPRAIEMKMGFGKNILTEKLCQHCSYITRFSKKSNSALQ